MKLLRRETVPGSATLIWCAACPNWRRHLFTEAGISAEWARHLGQAHGNVTAASDYTSKRAQRGQT